MLVFDVSSGALVLNSTLSGLAKELKSADGFFFVWMSILCNSFKLIIHSKTIQCSCFPALVLSSLSISVIFSTLQISSFWMFLEKNV